MDRREEDADGHAGRKDARRVGEGAMDIGHLVDIRSPLASITTAARGHAGLARRVWGAVRRYRCGSRSPYQRW